MRLRDFIHEAMDARFGYSIADVFFSHVSGVGDDCMIFVKVCQSVGFAAKQSPHGDRVPAPAASRKIVEEARRAEFPGAWPHGGKFESLHPAYTGSIVVMGEVDRGSDLEKPGFESRIQEPVSIDEIRTPCFHNPESLADPQDRNVPGRSAGRQWNPFARVRSDHLVETGKCVASTV